MSEQQKRGLGWYSRFVYPLLVLIFAFVFAYFERLRLDVGNQQITRQQYVADHQAIAQDFYIWGGAILIVGIIWAICVARDKKKYPEKYKRYL